MERHEIDENLRNLALNKVGNVHLTCLNVIHTKHYVICFEVRSIGDIAM